MREADTRLPQVLCSQSESVFTHRPQPRLCSGGLYSSIDNWDKTESHTQTIENTKGLHHLTSFKHKYIVPYSSSFKHFIYRIVLFILTFFSVNFISLIICFLHVSLWRTRSRGLQRGKLQAPVHKAPVSPSASDDLHFLDSTWPGRRLSEELQERPQ